MDELLAQFLVEAPELLEQADDALLALDRAPDDSASLNDAFRAVHTLKGSVGLFDLPVLERLLHAAEDTLSALRDGRRAVDPEVIRALQAVLDQTEAWLAPLATSVSLPPDASTRSLALMRQMSDAPGQDASGEAPAPDRIPDWALAMAQAELPPGSRTAIRYSPDTDAYFRGEDPLAALAGAPDLTHLHLLLTLQPEGPYDPFACTLVIEAASAAPREAVQASLRAVMDQVELADLPQPATDAGAAAQASARALRIDPARVDELAALADELVAAKTGLTRLAAQAAGERSLMSQRLTAQAEAIDRLASRLHQKIGALRMTPVQPLLRQFPRVAREIAAGLGRDVDLEVDAGQVHADRIILEGLFEPLTHLLRNAIDHGAETAEARLAKGKPARNRIRLAARQAAGRLLVTLEDDGRGIDPAAVRAAAASRGLGDEAALAALSEEQTLDLIFTPGFSTASEVSALSGRGVGMDAVRTAVHRLGGRISISSRVDVGTTVELSLPLAVSLTQVMVVSEAQERYGVPVEGVLATLRLPAARITAIRAGHAFDWRGRTVPLLPLSYLTGDAGRLDGEDRRVLVVRAGGQSVGLAVDAIEDRLDLAIRPLDGLLAGMSGLAGTAIMDDGQVLMILDPEALAS
jgi:two-component system chemotaxis sensor kinase CheA